MNFDGKNCSGTSAGSCTNGNTVCNIRDSFNIECVDRAEVGNYKIYWDRDFANTNYALMTAGAGISYSLTVNPVQGPAIGTKTTSSATIFTGSNTLAKTDWIEVDVVAFGKQ